MRLLERSIYNSKNILRIEVKLCAIIITYYPDLEEVINNINKLLPSVDHLIIWENTPSKDSDKNALRNFFRDKSNVSFLSTGRNEGIAYPLNRAIEWSINNKFTHILTMDQDLTWVNLKKFRTDVECIVERYKIFAPNTGGHDTIEPYKETNGSITSGTIYSLSIFNDVGLFCEKLFIDAVDDEFGWRAKLHGYRTCILTRHHLHHKLGYTVKGKWCISTGYSAIRRYHIIRNNVWFYRAYSKTFDSGQKNWIMGNLRYFVCKEPFKVILNENKKCSKISASIKGLIHGIFYPHPFKRI